MTFPLPTHVVVHALGLLLACLLMVDLLLTGRLLVGMGKKLEPV